MKLFLASVLAVATVSLNACAPRLGGSDYSVSTAGDIGKILPGTITSKKVVKIAARDAGRENDPGVGSLLGAGAGALLGSQIGGGRGQWVSGVAGGVLGGVGGHYAEQALTNQEGFEYQVRLDNGTMISITQGAEPNLGVGQRVNVIQSTRGNRSRIVAG